MPANTKEHKMKKIGKILITGSSGTIGTRLFEKLLAEKYNVIGFDRKPNFWNKNLDGLTIKGDLLKKQDFKKIPKNTDIIIHLAANTRVYNLVLDNDLALENIITAYNVLEFARENKIKKIIFSSSREVYGNRKKIIAEEGNVDIDICESSYAASKISDEALIHAYSRCFGIDYVILRFSNVYGMYDRSDRLVPLIIENLRGNKDVFVFGKDKILDFTYVDDCVTGIILACKKFDKTKNNIFNVASGKGINLFEFIKIIKNQLKSKSRLIMKKNRTGEVVKFTADISKAKKELGYKPKFKIKEGINLAINWYSKNVS